uniref:SP-RING-type domain-containing protein n=1 Tax=Angiostrongylus cantonensis TaxID=6313 RepID=A0A0K0DK39_ANGCA
MKVFARLRLIREDCNHLEAIEERVILLVGPQRCQEDSRTLRCPCLELNKDRVLSDDAPPVLLVSTDDNAIRGDR